MSTRSVHQFAEKVALVTHADSPIGRAVAIQLALQGSFVIGLFDSVEGGANPLEPLLELGTLAYAVNADPSSEAGAAAAAAQVDGHFGRLDLLVNCLKIGPESAFETGNGPKFIDVVSGTMGSVHFLTTAVFGLMANRPKPKIVNVVSAPATVRDPLFAATQAGVVELTRSLAERLPANFRVNCVEVPDDRGEKAFESPESGGTVSTVAADDVARAVLFLLSSESIGMNGQAIKLS